MTKKIFLFTILIFGLITSPSQARTKFRNFFAPAFFHQEKEELSKKMAEPVVSVLAFPTLKDADNYFAIRGQSKTSGGSGFIYKKEARPNGGLNFKVITNAHVVMDAVVVVVEVKSKDGVEVIYVAYPKDILIWQDWLSSRREGINKHYLDLAVINFDVSRNKLGMESKKFPDAVKIGTIALTNRQVTAFGKIYDLPNRKFINKPVAGEFTEITAIESLIKTTCHTEQGMSGCPLYNYGGELIGANVLIEKGTDGSINSYFVPPVFMKLVEERGRPLSELR